MNEGKLPIHYLGVPLISKRLTAAGCDALVSKIAGRIDSWLSRSLSFAGRLQLKRILFLLQQKFNRFLWGGKDSKAQAKVSWDKICAPKRE